MATKTSTSKLNVIIKPNNFGDLVSKIEDLCKISDIVKMKINNDNILIYSMIGTENIMLAFKCYEIKTKEYLDLNIDFTLNIIITSAKKFVKNLSFIKTTEKILMEITHKSDNDNGDNSNARLVQIKNGKFKLQIQTGENSEIKDINKSMLSKILDHKNKKWSFNISNNDFLDVKKLSSINSDETRKILHLNIENNKVILSESSLWELEIDEVVEGNKHLMFNKSYLGCINDNGGNIQFHIFESFILVEDDISSLMISFEQDFSDD